MGYDYTLYDRQIEELAAQNEKNNIKVYTGRILPEQKIKPVITLVLYYGKAEIPQLLAQKDAQIASLMEQLKMNRAKGS